MTILDFDGPERIPAILGAASNGQPHVGQLRAGIEDRQRQVIVAGCQIRRNGDGSVAEAVSRQPGRDPCFRAKTAGPTYRRGPGTAAISPTTEIFSPVTLDQYAASSSAAVRSAGMAPSASTMDIWWMELW